MNAREPNSAHPGRRPIAEWPGLRTFGSGTFRTTLAAVLLTIAIVLLGALLVRQAGDPDGQYGIDFAYWHQASSDVIAGRSPYPDRYLHEPVMATDFGYKYPPTFAQALIPLALTPLAVATTAWALVQAALGFLAVWLAGTYAGAGRSLERVLWSGVAVAMYMPFWDSVWKGNVSAVQSFQLSLLLAGGTVAGASLATGILLKTTPLALLPAVAAHGGKLLRALLVTGGTLAAISVIAAPQAWSDFIRMQPNLLTGPSVSPVNLAPASIAAIAAPEHTYVAGIVRLATVGVGVLAVGWAVLLARRPGGWPAAAHLGTVAILLIPGVIWYHYLAMLLPFAVYAWVKGSRWQRGSLLAAASAVTIGLAWLPLAAIGAAVLAASTLAVLLPSKSAALARAGVGRASGSAD